MPTRPPPTPAVLITCPWADRLATAMQLLRRPAEVLVAPPPGTPLPELVAVWRQWVPLPGDLNPIDQAARRWSAVFADRDGYGEALVQLLRAVENAIADALDQGQEHPELLHTAGYDTRMILSHFRGLDGNPVPLVAGRFLGDATGLPQGAGLREEDCPRFDNLAYAVLGPLHLDRRPRCFYLLGEAQRLTRLVKLRQDQEAAEQAEADRQEQLSARRRLETQPEVLLKRQLQRLATLEAEGLIPAEAPPVEPAVRLPNPNPTPARRE
jgi:hypothetical protein